MAMASTWNDRGFQARRAQWLPHVQREAQAAGIDWRILDAVLTIESGYRQTDAQGAPLSGDGGRAVGLGQLHPAAMQTVGMSADDRADPILNIRAAARYLGHTSKQFGGDPELTVTAYNVGPAGLRRNPSSTGHANYRGKAVEIFGLNGFRQATATPVASTTRAVGLPVIPTAPVQAPASQFVSMVFPTPRQPAPAPVGSIPTARIDESALFRLTRPRW